MGVVGSGSRMYVSQIHRCALAHAVGMPSRPSNQLTPQKTSSFVPKLMMSITAVRRIFLPLICCALFAVKDTKSMSGNSYAGVAARLCWLLGETEEGELV